MPRTSHERESGTSGGGARLYLDLDRDRGALGRQVEAELRGAIRDGRLAAGAALPSTRGLAHDLGVSRRLVDRKSTRLNSSH